MPGGREAPRQRAQQGRFHLPWRVDDGPRTLHRRPLRVGRPLLFSPVEGRDARAGGSPNLRNQVLSLGGRDREGLATPRFTHRLTDPRFAAQHRAPAVRTPQSLVSPLNPSGKPELQKSQNRRGPMIRDPFVAGQKGGVLGLSRKDALRNEPPGRSGRPTVGRYGGGRYGERFPIYVNRTRDQFAAAMGASIPSRTERPCS